MAAIDNVRATAIIQAMLGETAFVGFPTSAVGPMWVRLCSSAPGTNVTGTEIGGAGYTAGGISGNFGPPTTAGGAGPTAVGPTAAAISWTAGTNWTGANAIQGFELWDNAGTKLRWWFGAFTGGNVSVASGQVLQIAANAISVALT